MALFKYDSENLVYRKTNKILKYRVIVAVLFISVFFLSFIVAKKPEKEYIKAEITIKEDLAEEPVAEEVKEEATVKAEEKVSEEVADKKAE